MAASSGAGFPSTSASGNSRSAVWCLNQASPRLQAFLALMIRLPSACSSMSSHTQPQKVHVALFTTLTVMASRFLDGAGPARTGRYDEGSTKLPAGKAAADAARPVATRLDQLPSGSVRFLVRTALGRRLLVGLERMFRRQWLPPRLPSPWRWAFQFRPCVDPSAGRWAARTGQKSS